LLVGVGRTDKYRDCTQAFGPFHYCAIVLIAQQKKTTKAKRKCTRRKGEKEGVGMNLKLRTNLVGTDFVPVNLHTSNGESTTEGLEGGVTHGGIGGIESGVE
jgi:hypothetical protein